MSTGAFDSTAGQDAMGEANEMGNAKAGSTARYYRLDHLIITLDGNGDCSWDDGYMGGLAWYQPEKDRLVLADASVYYSCALHLDGQNAAEHPEWVAKAEEDGRRHAEALESTPEWDLTSQVVHRSEVENANVIVKLVPTWFDARRPCHACGGYTDRVSVLAEVEEGDYRGFRVCETCLKEGNVAKRIKRHAAALEREARDLWDLADRLVVPDYEEWEREIKRLDDEHRHNHTRGWISNRRYR